MNKAVLEISGADALVIARVHRAQEALRILDSRTPDRLERVVDGKTCRLSIYNLPTDEATWVVYVPWGDGFDRKMLRSSRVIVISKIDGRVVYDGSANDEG